MGIYNNKLFTETEVLDSVQDPDDPGVDLDQIEKDIMGDGNEAHSEEIEDANSGVIDDPLEESYNILYESEYNYNQLLQVIGINELYSATKGKEFILEASGVWAFLDKVAEIVRTQFKKFTTAVMKFIDKLRNSTVLDKKLFASNQKAIVAGAEVMSEKNAKSNKPVYEYPNFNYKFSTITLFGEFTQNIRKVKNGASNENIKIDTNEFSKENRNTEEEKMVRSIDSNATNLTNITEILLSKLRGNKVAKFDKSTIMNIVKVLNDSKDTTKIRESYKIVKDATAKTLDDINKMKKETKSVENVNKSNLITVCNYYTSLYRFNQNLNHHVYMIYLRAAKDKRNQARSIAMQCIARAPADLKKTKVQHNNASIFGNIDFA